MTSYNQAIRKANLKNKKNLKERPVLKALLNDKEKIKTEHLGLFLDKDQKWLYLLPYLY